MKRTALILCIIGIVTVCVGFIYDAAYTGIPLQDPEIAPTSTVKQYVDQKKSADNIFLVGEIFISIGMVLWVTSLSLSARRS